VWGDPLLGRLARSGADPCRQPFCALSVLGLFSSFTNMLYTNSILNKGSIGMILSKYGIPSPTVSVSDIKILCGGTLWMCRMTNCSFAYAFVCDFMWFYYCIIVYCVLCIVLCVFLLYYYCCFGVINDNNREFWSRRTGRLTLYTEYRLSLLCLWQSSSSASEHNTESQTSST